MYFLPLLTYGNIVLVWDVYNYYIVFNSVYNGVYYSGKAIQISYSLFQKILSFGKKNKKNYQVIKLENDWLCIKNNNEDLLFSIKHDDDWEIININK